MMTMLDSPLGSDLALLSLHVAREVDRKLGGGSLDEAVLRDLGRELSRASGLDEPATQAFLHADPVTTEVLAEVVSRISPEPPSDLKALGVAMESFLMPLNSNANALSTEKLETLKKFCLSLHRSIISQQLPKVYEEDKAFNDEMPSA
jgi:hypothetical protein